MNAVLRLLISCGLGLAFQSCDWQSPPLVPPGSSAQDAFATLIGPAPKSSKNWAYKFEGGLDWHVLFYFEADPTEIEELVKKQELTAAPDGELNNFLSTHKLTDANVPTPSMFNRPTLYLRDNGGRFTYALVDENRKRMYLYRIQF